MSRLRTGLLTTMFAFLLSSLAHAGNFGIGVMLGDPTAINAKAWTGRSSAVDFAMAWSDRNDRRFNVHADYLFHDYGVFNVEKGKLPLYYGIGGRVVDAEDPRVGIRIPVGLNYLFRNSSFDSFFEVAPVLDVTPETQMDFEAAIGARFYF